MGFEVLDPPYPRDFSASYHRTELCVLCKHCSSVMASMLRKHEASSKTAAHIGSHPAKAMSSMPPDRVLCSRPPRGKCRFCSAIAIQLTLHSLHYLNRLSASISNPSCRGLETAQRKPQCAQSFRIPFDLAKSHLATSTRAPHIQNVGRSEQRGCPRITVQRS